MKLSPSRCAALSALALACWLPAVQAHPVPEVTEDFATTPAGIYWRGVLYRAGMKITRPLATNDGGYPYGSFAISWNEGEGEFPGLGPHRIDSYAQLQDSSNAPFEVEFDRPATSFSINANDAPAANTIDVVWLKAYDYSGGLIAEARFKRSKAQTQATTLTVTAPEGLYIARVSFGSQQNGAYGWGVFWGNIRYTPLAAR
jgi:hypothetical protein